MEGKSKASKDRNITVFVRLLSREIIILIRSGRFVFLLLLWIMFGALAYSTYRYAPDEFRNLIGSFASGRGEIAILNINWFDMAMTKIEMFTVVILMANRLPAERNTGQLQIYMSKRVRRFDIILARYFSVVITIAVLVVVSTKK